MEKEANKDSSKSEGIKDGTKEGIDIADTGRIFIRNLPFTISEEDLRSLFEPYGQLSEVFIPLDPTLKRSKGFAYVSFVFPGRLLHLIPAQSKPKSEVPEGTDEKMSYKKKKELKQKAEAERADNWNTLFIRADAVGDAISAKYNIKKAISWGKMLIMSL